MSKSRIRRALVYAMLAASAALAAGQSTGRLGNEFQVSVYTPTDQLDAVVAADADGDFVVAWRSDLQDGDASGIFARRFGSTGVPLGVEFQVNLLTVGDQIEASVSRDADGDFVVTWQADDASGTGVFARRFDSSGTAQGGVFQVNAYIFSSQYRGAVALDADGDFVVAWSSYLQDGSQGGVFARLFAANGSPGVEFRVNAITANHQSQPAVARDQDGNFVVVWESYGQDGAKNGIFGRLFNVLGTAQAVEFQVNSSTLGGQLVPRVDMEADGDFVVVWQGESTVDNYEVFFQRFGSSGARLGPEVQVNTHTSQYQLRAAVAVDSSGAFIVTWMSDGQDGAAHGIFARHFDAFGTPLGNELQVNTYTPGVQSAPRVDMDASGKFVVVWEGPRDGVETYGIFGQRYRTLANLDVDGDGAFQPLTDGLLVLRYGFGFRGATLINGVVGPGCTRCTAPEIEAHIAGQV